MMSRVATTGLVLALATYTHAQGFGGYDGGNNPYSNSNNGGSSSSSSSSSSNPFSNGNNPFTNGTFSTWHTMLTAHAVLATLAFALLFPIGGILIRLASFPGLWWIHGLFQALAFLLYTAAFGIGIYMATNMRMLSLAHPIIGIVLFALLIFQPVLGVLHHVMFKKYKKRTVWSYGHIWLGRGAITLGIVNGGLGLELAQRTRRFAPSTSAIIAYGVVAGLIWLVYIASAVYGEVKRSRGRGKEEYHSAPPAYTAVDGREKRHQYA